MQNHIAALLACALTAASAPASALAAEGSGQQATPPETANEVQPKPTSPADADDPCRASPGDNSASDDGNGSVDEQATAGIDGATQGSGKLEACDGVLKPPRNGASGIVQPAPDVGRTPVIPPEQLPEQQAPKP